MEWKQPLHHHHKVQKITYTKVGGDISMIDIDANTGAITYKGNNAFGKSENTCNCG